MLSFADVVQPWLFNGASDIAQGISDECAGQYGFARGMLGGFGQAHALIVLLFLHEISTQQLCRFLLSDLLHRASNSLE